MERWLPSANGVLIDDRTRKALTEALEQAQAQQQRREINLIRMFESTKQDNHSVKEAFKSLLADISEADQSRNANLSKLVRLGEQFERSVRGLQNTKHELNQAITSARNASVEAQK